MVKAISASLLMNNIFWSDFQPIKCKYGGEVVTAMNFDCYRLNINKSSIFLFNFDKPYIFYALKLHRFQICIGLLVRNVEKDTMKSATDKIAMTHSITYYIHLILIEAHMCIHRFVIYFYCLFSNYFFLYPLISLLLYVCDF